ncbi:hypothetical protein L228DRAFT_247252 [Xylona heveae TC161]|uniref:Uncharacterized protein n=1 Tax=Xylona heveae (strain CBS 132557 / TC161) TaxID=1328760 RepID=A0A165H0Z7_XYLHT|nr:hypothetical protein L228DRAFT_247252 [Xylona heveae TC161]KZF22851.1 hypothetical protein L228DRAFT_247252 [Xylona heveae TC161]
MSQVVKSRDSVYEILWKDDYSSESYSSSASMTPRMSVQLERISTCLRALAQGRDSRQSSNASSGFTILPGSDTSTTPDNSRRVSIIDKQQYQQEKNRLASNFARWDWSNNPATIFPAAVPDLKEEGRGITEGIGCSECADQYGGIVPGFKDEEHKNRGVPDDQRQEGRENDSSSPVDSTKNPSQKEEDKAYQQTSALHSPAPVRQADEVRMGYALGASQHRRRSSVLSAPVKPVAALNEDEPPAMATRDDMIARFKHRDSLALTRKRYSKRGITSLGSFEA